MSNSSQNENKHAYFVGGGIASFAGAFYLIQDAGVPAENIHIFEQDSVTGGSLDGSGSLEKGFLIRGGRMFEEHYVNMWEFLDEIPSIEEPGKSVKEETFDFNKVLISDAKCRLLKKNMEKIDVSSYGFNAHDQRKLLELTFLPESLLDNKTIEDWFDEHFFETPFWYLWRTTFAFQSWSSLIEMRRYFIRFIHLFPEFHRLGGILRTKHNQYDSMILPAQKWLQDQGVDFMLNTEVTDVKFDIDNHEKRVTGLTIKKNGVEEEMTMGENDYVFVTLGSIPSASSTGAWDKPAVLKGKEDSPAWRLWDKIAAQDPEFGNPDVFSGDVEKSKWQTCTITLRNPYLFDFVEEFTGNVAGTGGLVTFTESSWLLSFFLPYQPHFLNQPEDAWVFWAYGLFPNNEGDFVKKPMQDCTGEEILVELLHHLNLEDKMEMIMKDANAIPCIMPFADAEFMPRAKGDRPQVVPKGAANFTFMGQFVEIPDDVVYTVEYSVRSARMAVYDLFDVDKKVPKVYQGMHDVHVLHEATKAMRR